MLLKLLKEESGQAMVIFVLVFAVLCGAAGLAIDVGRLTFEKSTLQNAADAAALAGVKDLPDTATANSTAIYYAGQNGVKASEITTTAPYNGDSTEIEVVCTKTVSYTFAKVLGLTSKTVSARSVAQKGKLGAAFDYTLFSGDKNETLTINGSSFYVGGDAHSNYKFNINGSSQTITGSGEAVSNFTINGSSITIGDICEGSSISTNGSNIKIGNRVSSPALLIDMPDFSNVIKNQAEAAGQAYTGNKTFNGSGISVDSPIYVNGNVTINGSRFAGKGCILATGDITFNGSNLTNTSGDAVCFYSGKNITINGSSIALDGIVYAPNGTITMNGSNQIVNGRVVGDKLTFNGSNYRIISGTNDLKSLPGSSAKLIE